MPIVAEVAVQFRPPGIPDRDRIGDCLAERNWMQFAQVMGVPGIGLGTCSCNATVAVNLGFSYEIERYGRFAVLHGNSQIYRGLDHDFQGTARPRAPFSMSGREEHAEQVAVGVATRAAGPGLWSFQNRAHIYIDLTPCPACRQWLTQYPVPFVVYYHTRYEDARPNSLDRLHRSIFTHYK